MQPLPLQLFFLRDKRERVSECRPPQNTCASKRCLMVFEIPQEGYLRRGSNTSKHRLEEDIEVCWPSSEFLFLKVFLRSVTAVTRAIFVVSSSRCCYRMVRRPLLLIIFVCPQGIPGVGRTAYYHLDLDSQSLWWTLR